MNDRFKYRFYAVNYKTYVDATLESFIGSDMIPIYKNGNFLTMEKTTDVIPEQCTGLRDKNGKLIYEGDIVYNNLDGGTQKVIYWDDGLASFMAYNRYPDKHYTQRIGDGYFIELGFEVIGNIHENADLLEIK